MVKFTEQEEIEIAELRDEYWKLNGSLTYSDVQAIIMAKFPDKQEEVLAEINKVSKSKWASCYRRY